MAQDKIPSLIPTIETSISTSGTLYSLERGKNYEFFNSDNTLIGDSLWFSVENLSPFVNTLRGSDYYQFQLELAPNEAMDFYLPFTDSLIITTTNLLKIADVDSLVINKDKDFDILQAPAGPIKINSKDGTFQENHWFETSGLTNIFFAGSHKKTDLVYIEYGAPPVVSQFDRLRLFTKGAASYLGRLPKIVNLGYSDIYSFRCAMLKKRVANPGYVPPEVSLWKLTNEATV